MLCISSWIELVTNDPLQNPFTHRALATATHFSRCVVMAHHLSCLFPSQVKTVQKDQGEQPYRDSLTFDSRSRIIDSLCLSLTLSGTFVLIIGRSQSTFLSAARVHIMPRIDVLGPNPFLSCSSCCTRSASTGRRGSSAASGSGDKWIITNVRDLPLHLWNARGFRGVPAVVVASVRCGCSGRLLGGVHAILRLLVFRPRTVPVQQRQAWAVGGEVHICQQEEALAGFWRLSASRHRVV